MDTRDQQAAPIVMSAKEWQREMGKLGRTNQVLAASSHLSVVLKTYASGGENELHAHTNEDHVFLVLQGAATFYGPRGETRHVRQHEGVLIPRGALYGFTPTNPPNR